MKLYKVAVWRCAWWGGIIPVQKISREIIQGWYKKCPVLMLAA